MDITQNNNQGALLTYSVYAQLVFVKVFNLPCSCSSTLKSGQCKRFSTSAI